MTDERRYGEDEVREIFELATSKDEPPPPALAERRGLTLEELQGIAREVGVEPARVADAAAALEARGNVLPRRTRFGMPVSVGRIVELPRAPTDLEWQTLVGELRHTFGARGKVAAHGELREWSNGNLHVCVEPAETGYRLRMGTVKGTASTFNQLGIVGLLMALFMVIAFAAQGRLAGNIFGPLLLAMLGGGALGANWIGLPRWADERERQMAYIAERAVAMLEAPSGGAVPRS